jgi:hypothetical protein
LGLLFPEKLEALRERAQAIALHRIEAGVHYPVDVEGGQNLADKYSLCLPTPLVKNILSGIKDNTISPFL